MADAVPGREENGGIYFTKPDGSEVFVQGQQAQDLRQRYEARHGQMSAPPPMSGGMSGAPPEPSPPAPSSPVDPVMTPAGGLPGVPPPEQPRPAGPPPPQLSPGAAYARMAREGGKMVHSPGRPEFSPAAVGAFDPSGGQVTDPRASGYVRSTGTQTREAGPPVDQQYLGEMGMLRDASTELARIQTQRQLAEADRDASMAAEEAAAAKARAADGQAELQEREDAYRRDEQTFQEVSQQIRERKINPNRLFQQRGTFGNILSAIGQALGAAASAGSGVPNFAFQAEQNAIARDIAAQESELDTLGDRATSALAIMDRHFRDRSEAKIAVERLMREAVEAERGIYVARSNNPKLQESYAQFVIQQQQAQSELGHKMRTAAMGKRRIQENAQWAQYQAPKAGGSYRRALTPEEAMSAAERGQQFDERMGYKMSPEQQFKLAQEREKQRGEGGKLTRTGATKIGEAEAAAAPARQAMEDLASAAGLELDPTTGRYKIPEGSEGQLPGVGMIGGTAVGRIGARGRRVQQLQEGAVLHFGRFISGAEVPEQQAQRITEAMTGAWGTEREFVDGLNAALAQIDAKGSSARRTYGPGAAAEFDRRSSEVNAADTAARANAPPQPERNR